jgi:predicted short-subunit dehydrogenase-like oxidoreductase (DUF2520 family)
MPRLHQTCRDEPSICDAAGSLSGALERDDCPSVALELNAFKAVLGKRLPAPTADYILVRAHKIARIHCPGDVAPIQAPQESSR